MPPSRSSRLRHSGGMTDALPAIPHDTPLTRLALNDLGYDARALSRLIASGELERVTRGVYLASPKEVSRDEHVAARRNYLRRAVALSAAFPGSYLVGPSACVALDLPLLRLPEQVHMSRDRQIHSTRSEVVSRRPWAHPVISVDGLDVQHPTAAVIEVAALAGTLDGLVPADAAARRRMLTQQEQLLAAWGRRKGAAAARVALTQADGRRESPLETQVAWAAAGVGVSLVPQPRILDEHGHFVARADFRVAGHRVIVEVDGLTKYRSEADLHGEKLRQGEIERLGWVVVRVVARDIHTGRLVTLLRDAIVHADRLFGSTRD